MKRFVLKTSVFALAAAAAVAFTSPTMAAGLEHLKGKKITWIVPFKEGGGTDGLVRLFAPYLSKELGADIVVLNKPGGGGVKAANAWEREKTKDGTKIIMASTSNFIPYTLGQKKVKYDPLGWELVFGQARSALIYANPSKTPVKAGASVIDNIKALQGADNLLLGIKTPQSTELLDFVVMEGLGVKMKPVFGLSTSKQRQAYFRGETTVNQDGTGPYLKKVAKNNKGEPHVNLFQYGYLAGDGTIKRSPLVPDLPTYAEVYTELHGKAPSGGNWSAYQAILHNKVTLSKVVALPKGTDKKIVDGYIAAFKNLYANDEVRDKVAKSFSSLPPLWGDDIRNAMVVGTKIDAESKGYLNELAQSRLGAALF